MSLQNSKTTRERALAQTLIDDTSSAISGIINSDWHSLYTSEGGIGYWPIDEGADIAADNKVVLDEIFGNNGLINLGHLWKYFLSSSLAKRLFLCFWKMFKF